MMMLERRKSSGGFSTGGSSTGGGGGTTDDALAEALAEFTVEEEQVLKGVELIYSDRLNEAEEFFETLRSGHARFNLHYAEVAVVVALMSYDLDDIARASVLLTETEAVAAQQAQKWKSHSNLQKVNEAVTNIKKWAIGNTKKMGQAIGATALGQAVGGAASAVQAVAGVPPKAVPEVDEDAEEAPGTPHSKEDLKWIHRSRRSRLWALQFQAECHLMNSLLQIVGAGESWTSMMKLGYNLQRTWSVYKHCQSKLKQLYKQWVELEGTFGLPNQLDAAATPHGEGGEGVKAQPLPARSFEHSVSLPPRPPPPSYEESSTALKWNQKPEPVATITAATSGPSSDAIQELEVIDEAKGIKEDKELSCLRLGVEFGSGAFNLVVSLIPSNYQKAVEVMGAPADRARGLSLLDKVARSNHARAPLASLLLLHYHTVIEGLFPYSPEHSRSAESIIAHLPPAIHSGSIYRVIQSRLARYEGDVRKSVELMESAVSNLEGGLTWQGNNRRLKDLMLDELGWSLLLQAEFTRAAECFGRLYEDSLWFKPFYAYLQAACLWEAPESFHEQAAGLLRDLPTMASNKRIALEPLEQLGLSVATAFVSTNQAPLFPALELAALYNGFQQMEKPALERHRQNLEDCLRSSRLGARGSDFVEEFKFNAAEELVGVVSAKNSETSSSGSGRAASTGAPKSRFEHKWTKASKLRCRYLLALCQLNLGEKQAAVDNFRYVVAATEVVPGNVVPYSCYELGSVMLQADGKSEEGFELLDRVHSYPPHEFQSRLKFIVTETIKMYGGTMPVSKEEVPDPELPPTHSLDRKKSNIFSKAVNLGNLSNLGNNLSNLGNLGNLGHLGNINPFARKGGEGQG